MINEKNIRESTAKGYYYKVKRILEIANWKWSSGSILDAIKEYNPKYTTNVKAGIKHLEEYLVKLGYPNLNVYEQINRNIKWKAPRFDIISIFEAPTEEEVKRGFHIIEDKRVRMFYALATVTGLRISELFEIKAENINLEQRIINLNLDRKTKKVFFAFFNSEVRDMLEDYMKSLNGELLFEGLGIKKIRVAFKKISKVLNKRFYPYLLRKFFATYSVENGIEPLLVDFLQGRVGYSILIRHYLKPSIKELREKYDKIWERFSFSDTF